MATLKDIKKGDKVLLRLFTGAFVDARVVEMADAKKIGFSNRYGIKMIFDKETGKQISPEPKFAKYASYLEVYDPKVEAAESAKKRHSHKMKPKKEERDPYEEYEEVD